MATIDREKLGEYLSAYLDGELSESEREAIERLLARDAGARAQLDELRQTVEAVRALPRRAAPPSLLENLTATAERQQLLGDPADQIPVRRPWWHSARPVLSMAAVLAITIGGGLIVYHNMTEPVRGPAVADLTPTAEEGPAAVKPVESEESQFALGEKSDAPVPAARARGVVEAAPGARDRMLAEAGRRGGRGAIEKRAEAKSELADRSVETDRMADAVVTVPPTPGEAAPAPPESSVLADATGAVTYQAPSDLKFQHLVAGLTLEQKNEAGLGGEALANHLFANESNQIAVLANDRDDELLARSQLAVFAKEKNLRTVVAGPQMPSLSNAVPLYMEGRPRHNYDAAAAAQVLVRLPASEVPELLTAVGYNPSGWRPMRMRVGPLVAEGLEETQRVAAQMQPPERLGMPMDAYAMAPRGKGAPAGGRGVKKGSEDAEAVSPGVVVRVVPEAAGPTITETGASAGVPKDSSKERLARADDASERGGVPSASDDEVVEKAGELVSGLAGVMYRLFGSSADADGHEDSVGSGEAFEGTAAEEKLDVPPGRLVDRNLVALKDRPTKPDGTMTSLYYDGRREKGKAVERLITLVVEFQKLPTAAKPVTQPVRVEGPAEGAEGTEGE